VAKAVFDCNIFAQALMNPRGPAGACLQAAFDGQIRLFVADFIFAEIRDLPNKPTPARAGVTTKKVEDLVQLLLIKTEFVAEVPELFRHPIDEDDSDYVNLALVGDTKRIVSRDRHLLNLNDASKPWSADFRSRFPQLRVVGPEQMLAEVRAESV
jgi:putative PIN family toxin of toxin-antitoxin system